MGNYGDFACVEIADEIPMFHILQGDTTKSRHHCPRDSTDESLYENYCCCI